MIKKLSLALISTMLPASCGNNPDPSTSEDEGDYSQLKIVSPTGAPTLAIFTEGNNPNWETKSTPTLVNAELQNNNYDVVIAPAYGALDSIKEFSCDFALARVITGGNFYLVGINKSAEDRPTSDSYIVGFAHQDVSGKVLEELYKNHWNLGEPTNIDWVNGAADTLGILKAGHRGGKAVDYVLTAEPVFTNAKSQLDEGVTLVETYDIRKEWKDYSNQDALVQAGVFLRKSAIESKRSQFKALLNKIDENIELATTPETIKDVVATLNAYNEDVKKQAARFGYNANLVNALQSNNKNRFGLVRKEVTIDVNAFLTKLGDEPYDSSYFVTLE